MKTVILLRHAKSDWGDAQLADIDRPLSQRGRRDAPLMGQWISQQIKPDIALVSPAKRAQETFEALRLDIPVRTETDLYPTQTGHLLRILQNLSAEQKSALIVGHNPGISGALEAFLHWQDDDPYLNDMPTCSAAIVDFDLQDWRQLEYGMGTLRDFMRPKALLEER